MCTFKYLEEIWKKLVATLLFVKAEHSPTKKCITIYFTSMLLSK